MWAGALLYLIMKTLVLVAVAETAFIFYGNMDYDPVMKRLKERMKIILSRQSHGRSWYYII
jgi:hypothetical protein